MQKRTSMRTHDLPRMPGDEFKLIRLKLGMSQSKLAAVLGYRSPMRVSELERATNPLPVPWMVGQLMRAMAEGFVPDTAAIENPFDLMPEEA